MTHVKGFTLLELIAVLILIGIISTIVGLHLPKNTNYNVRGQYTSILKDIQLTQTLALTNTKTYKIVFTSSSYQIMDSANNLYTFPDTNSTTVTMQSGVNLSTSSSTISFDFSGVPYDVNNNVLTSAATVTITGTSGTSYQITIQPQTGFSQ